MTKKAAAPLQAKIVVAPLQAKIVVVCPTCGEMIEVKVEGLTNYGE